MAKDTCIDLRNKVIYSIYVRNYSEEGSFLGVEKDLDRIKKLGVDIIWFMPIHPIGEKNKKGELGCPYAIKDYRNINSEYGSLEEFKHLVNEIHLRGMKCIIDVVYNHTSPDSWLVNNRPEYFYRKSDGNLGNRIGEWWDVVDLDYSNKELWKYQIDTLKMWAEIVDGFRCDVASIVPVEFWEKARQEIGKVNKDCLWLAESVDRPLIRYVRDNGFDAWSDSELYRAFDICYDYDIKSYFQGYLDGKCTLTNYIERLNEQEMIYPQNYVKLRFLENHDLPRIRSKVEDENELLNWTSFMYFQKGTTMIYNGQEAGETHVPSLFEHDKIRWDNGTDLSHVMKKLYEIKKNNMFKDGNYKLVSDEKLQVVIGYYEKGNNKIVGIFSLKGNSGDVEVDLKDAQYTNLFNNSLVKVKNGCIKFEEKPIIINI